MEEHPIEGLMMTAMDSIQDMVDVNTIIGEPIETKNNITIIPISKVSFGFAAGGSEFRGETLEEYSKKDRDEEITYRNPFGGGSGAAVSINPVAFLVVQDSNVKLYPVSHTSAIDKLLDYVPDLFEKVNNMLNKVMDKQDKKSEEKTEEKKKKSKENKQTVTYEFNYKEPKQTTHEDNYTEEQIDEDDV